MDVNSGYLNDIHVAGVWHMLSCTAVHNTVGAIFKAEVPGGLYNVKINNSLLKPDLRVDRGNVVEIYELNQFPTASGIVIGYVIWLKDKCKIIL